MQFFRVLHLYIFMNQKTEKEFLNQSENDALL